MQYFTFLLKMDYHPSIDPDIMVLAVKKLPHPITTNNYDKKSDSLLLPSLMRISYMATIHIRYIFRFRNFSQTNPALKDIK